jgi:hypothetical protein
MVLGYEPENKAAQQQILECKERINEQRNRERKLFAGIFDKLGKGVDQDNNENKNEMESS